MTTNMEFVNKQRKNHFWLIMNDRNNLLYGLSKKRKWDRRVFLFLTKKDAVEFIKHRKKIDKFFKLKRKIVKVRMEQWQQT